MILKDSINVKASTDAIFRFFDEMERHYLEWHPDHLLLHWIAGHGM